MDKAVVIADLAKVGFYSEIATIEIKKDPFDVTKMVNSVFDLQNAMLRIVTEILTDSTVIASQDGYKLQQLKTGLIRTLSNIQ